ncbi:MAG TPA: hydroxyectoine utilization dehydratase EutB [Candidatus Sulfomarinibacteraceae bacterium]|nr:hydroxyectoine utilization dehydratase EutB [Candidatus Sulfomarinibacteraceae bacterium]
MVDGLSAKEIFEAQARIAPVTLHTPLLPSSALSNRDGRSVYLKLETLQETGTFKVRGAANKILSLPEAQRARGVVTASTGNHGRAVSHVARELGIPAVVCISERVPQNKVEALRQSGAELVIEGNGQDEAAERAFALQEERGLTMVHPFDDPLVIAGQGTIGLEMLDEAPELDTVLVPLSGGGLISGVALALKSAALELRVIGVSMEHSPVMYHSLQAGRPVQMPEEETLADSLLGGIGLENRYTFDLVRQLVDDVILVTEEEIARAMAFLLREQRLVVEGAGAVGVAALLAGKVPDPGRNVGVVISGGNVALDALLRIAQA